MKDQNSTFVGSVSAVILAGGQGTRLRSVLADRQKVVALVDQRPFLTFLLQKVYDSGIDEIILACGYKAETVRDALTDFPKLKYSLEEEPLGTGGALIQALQQNDAEKLLVMNGDSFLDFALEEFLRWFEQHTVPAAMVLSKVDDVSRYGQVNLQDGMVQAFNEKQAGGGAGWINAGIYCFERKILLDLPWKGKFSLERDLFPLLVAKQQLAAYPCEGYFIDIGTPETWQQAQQGFKKFNSDKDAKV
jgi:D-glycero-alpha-D-manno-heptose 1-phosphate guanylyltransferase